MIKPAYYRTYTDNGCETLHGPGITKYCPGETDNMDAVVDELNRLDDVNIQLFALVEKMIEMTRDIIKHEA